MALNLDARQRAMLQDMGITVWGPRTQPTPSTAEPADAAVLAAAPAKAAVHDATVEATRRPTPTPAAEPVAPSVPRPAAPTPSDTAPPTPTLPMAPSAPASQPLAATWWTAPLVHAYADLPHDATDDAGWLVLLECADPLDPFAGETGALLNNMLRALRLQRHPRVRIAPLTRQAPADGAASTWQPLAPAVHNALATHQPARVLLMGLHAARAVLGRSEALGPLRAMVHSLHNTPTVVTYDPAYLLRAAHAKPGAWADLCRAHALQPPDAATPTPAG